MCTLCQATTTFDPTRHPDGSTAAQFTETTDAAASIATIYAMQVGDTFSGTLSDGADEDWVAIEMVAGQTYSISLEGDSLSDPYLEIYSSSGSLIASNDDGASGLDSQINFTASSTGTYYIAADGYGTLSGSYDISVSAGSSDSSAPVGTPGQLANYLTNGFWEDNGQGARSFNTSGSNEITVNISGLTPDGQQLARWAFEAWEMVADIDFVVVSGSADITFVDDNAGAYSSTSYDGNGNIVSSTVNISTSWLNSYGTTIDSYSFSTYVHEIGHALGLGHLGNYDGNATYGVSETFSNDSYQMSVMSYFSQSDNTSINATYGEPITAMVADIIAIQNLYGAPDSSSSTAGNTTWGGTNSSSNLPSFLQNFFDAAAGGSGGGNIGTDPVVMTIYDQGGVDTVDLTWSGTGDRVDMNGGSFSDINGGIGNIGIAVGTTLENVLAGAGNDHVTGNNAANMIEGNAGNDTLLGGNGWDVLNGGIGDDLIRGGNGADTADLGGGNDTYTDTAQTGANGADFVNGGAGNDSIATGGGADEIMGGAGADTMTGGNQNDTLEGGNGRDVAYLGNGNDVYNDNTQGGFYGADRVFGGNGNDTVNGGAGGDTIAGGNGNDLLRGGNGNDDIEGGAGADRIYGGNHNDNIVGGNGRDLAFMGNGSDTFEDNSQSGFFGGDRVFGGSGNDTIEMQGGNDTATGGTGADTFDFVGGTIEADVITDFEVGTDTMDLDSALVGGTAMSAADLVSTYASVTADGVLFDFGDGNTILLEDLTTTAGLAADLAGDAIL